MRIAWDVFELAVRILVGGRLAAEGVLKVSSVANTRRMWLVGYQLLPARLVGPVVMLFPVAELACGVGLLLGAFGRVGVLAALLMLDLLIVAVAASLSGRVTISHSRLGRLAGVVSWRMVARNGVLSAALALVLVFGHVAFAVTVLGWPVQSAMLVTGIVLPLAAVAVRRRRQRRRLTAALANGLTPGILDARIIGPFTLSTEYPQ